MKALLWKEMRILRVWILAGIALVGALRLLWIRWPSEISSFSFGLFAPSWDGLIFLTATLASVGLAAGQVAGERQAKTLDYLLVRPVAADTIVWAKFLAGTIALLLLLGALVWLGYSDPGSSDDLLALLVRDRVSSLRVLLTLFPRYWCVYGLALLLSVLVDRPSKAAVAMAVSVMTLLGMTSWYTDIAPFSGFESWLPFFDQSTGGLVRVARNPSLFWTTSLVLYGIVLVAAFGAGTLLKRSPENYLGNRTLMLGAAGLVGVAILTGWVSGGRLPSLPPEEALEIQTGSAGDLTDMAASGHLVCLGLQDRLVFLDFSDRAKPRTMADVRIPLWTTSHLALVGTSAYVLGKKKALPTDEVQIIIAKLAGPDSVQIMSPISLGPVDPRGSIGPLVPLGHFLYAGSINHRQCRVHVLDLSTSREMVVLPIDTLHTVSKEQVVPLWADFREALTMCLRESFLYIASPSALTTLDLGNPAQPVVTNRIEFRESIARLYGLPRTLLSQGDRLYETSFWPPSLRSYDLSDPSRPVLAADFAWHRTDGGNVGAVELVVSGPAFYQSWRNGVLEFHLRHKRFEALRYLDDGYGVDTVAVSGAHVYTARYDYGQKSEHVDAFQVRE